MPGSWLLAHCLYAGHWARRGSLRLCVVVTWQLAMSTMTRRGFNRADIAAAVLRARIAKLVGGRAETRIGRADGWAAGQGRDKCGIIARLFQHGVDIQNGRASAAFNDAADVLRQASIAKYNITGSRFGDDAVAQANIVGRPRGELISCIKLYTRTGRIAVVHGDMRQGCVCAIFSRERAAATAGAAIQETAVRHIQPRNIAQIDCPAIICGGIACEAAVCDAGAAGMYRNRAAPSSGFVANEAALSHGQLQIGAVAAQRCLSPRRIQPGCQ